MTVLANAQRQKITNGVMRYWSRFREPTTGITKHDLKEAIDATDSWINSNAASFDNALPAAIKTNLTAEQKTLLFCSVAAFRVSKDFAVRLLGGVD